MSSYLFQEQAQQASSTPSMHTMIDPYLYQTLQSVIQREVAIQTTQGNIRGNVVDVLPDHVVLETGGSTFFVRIQQIVWVMPF
ncbi:YuzF family protein [Brevibacillus sp. 179-C9.3 HS]|uniref:YuzF family protein n=1 Tax=unclassified Brevibacillus TaxID=2684853 RepID=UPI00399F0E7F